MEKSIEKSMEKIHTSERFPVGWWSATLKPPEPPIGSASHKGSGGSNWPLRGSRGSADGAFVASGVVPAMATMGWAMKNIEKCTKLCFFSIFSDVSDISYFQTNHYGVIGIVILPNHSVIVYRSHCDCD